LLRRSASGPYAEAHREVDIVAAWSVDRLGRSLQHLLHVLGDIHAKGVDPYLHQQGLDTTTPSGKAMFQMLGVFGEFERAMIRERVNAGLARAKAQGKQLGRPTTATPTLVAEVGRLRAEGMGINAIAKALGKGTSFVQRVLAANSIGANPPARLPSAGIHLKSPNLHTHPTTGPAGFQLAEYQDRS
jgi:DNA invertase Pin-like site-specific DNA recombinase